MEKLYFMKKNNKNNEIIPPIPKKKHLGLNLGCGFVKFKEQQEINFISLDIDPVVKPDIVRDVLQGLPFDDEKFDVVVCHHFLEHFAGESFVFIINECHRVLKSNGELVIYSPYYKHFGAWTDPHHKFFFREESLEAWFFPSNSSYSMGIKGFFYPVTIKNVEDKEMRFTLRKVNNAHLKSYVEQVGTPKKKDGGQTTYETPNFFDLIKNNYGKHE